jgi:hypothetical protein
MSLRISSTLAAAAVLPAACAAESPPPPGESVVCAIGEGAEFVSNCTLERTAAGAEIVIHHPDGGFRRLLRDPATGALTPRDGAEMLVPAADEGDAIAFAIGPDRYRIPRSLLDPVAQPSRAQ